MTCRRPRGLFFALCCFLAPKLIGAGPAPTPLNPPLLPASPEALIALGDEHYGLREQEHSGARASAAEILEAISAYDKASESSDGVRARWKLARALYFRGAYTGLDADARRGVFEKARRVSEEAIAILMRQGRPASGAAPSRVAEALRGDPDAAQTFFWASVSWGEWALSTDKLKAIKAGAATKIRDDATIVIALDPNVEEGGGYRILGRLHDRAPRIPLLTWWVSRREALANLRRAVAVAPRNLINLHFLAEALAQSDATNRPEAIRLEQQVVAAVPSPTRLVEEIYIQGEARRNLVDWSR